MVYSVNLAERAVRNIRAIYKFINAENSAPAAKWLDGLEEAVFSLDRHPQRGQIIPEDRALRHLLYGNKPHIYRIIYSIDDTRKTVTVLTIRHAARTSPGV
jgi:plasmid stabilization system protein ParE